MLRRRRKITFSPGEFSDELLRRYGRKLTIGAVQRACREKRIVCRDLNVGTGKRPRYRIPERELKRVGEGR